MSKYLLATALLAVLGLTACDKPTVIIPATPVAVPGPAGPQGTAGSQGADGNKGDTGKTGADGGTAVIVVPAETPPAK